MVLNVIINTLIRISSILFGNLQNLYQLFRLHIIHGWIQHFYFYKCYFPSEEFDLFILLLSMDYQNNSISILLHLLSLSVTSMVVFWNNILKLTSLIYWFNACLFRFGWHNNIIIMANYSTKANKLTRCKLYPSLKYFSCLAFVVCFFVCFFAVLCEVKFQEYS